MKRISMEQATALANRVSNITDTSKGLTWAQQFAEKFPEKYRPAIKGAIIGAISGTTIGVIDSNRQAMTAPFSKGGFRTFRDPINPNSLSHGAVLAAAGIPTGAALGYLYHKAQQQKELQAKKREA